jgi:hypothetical protein
MVASIVPRIIPVTISAIEIDCQSTVVRFIKVDFIIFTVVIDIDIIGAADNDFGRVVESDDTLSEFSVYIFHNSIIHFFVQIKILVDISSVVFINVSFIGNCSLLHDRFYRSSYCNHFFLGGV